MKTPITPWIELTLHHAQRCHHRIWFLYGCLDREHMLNANTFVASWARGIAWPLNRLLLPTHGRRTAASAKPLPRAGG